MNYLQGRLLGEMSLSISGTQVSGMSMTIVPGMSFAYTPVPTPAWAGTLPPTVDSTSNSPACTPIETSSALSAEISMRLAVETSSPNVSFLSELEEGMVQAASNAFSLCEERRRLEDSLATTLVSGVRVNSAASLVEDGKFNSTSTGSSRLID